MKHILDKNFRYVRAVETDIRKTFARIRREQKVPDPKVTPIKPHIKARSA